MLTWTCALRHNGVQSFDIGTSKEAGVFCLFDLEMCFAPQRYAIFDIWTTKVARQKWQSRIQKWATLRVFLTILVWRCALRRNAVHFFISHLATWLRTPALASLLLDPPGPQIGKTQCFATCLTFRAPVSSFFWLFLCPSSILFFYSSTRLFSLLLLFSLLVTSPYCRKFDL